MSSEEEIKQNYSDHLKAIHYHKEITDFFHTHKEVFQEAWDLIYDVVSSDKYKGSKLLDIGSGATVHNIAGASIFCPNIVLSDYVEDNCTELRKWLKKESFLDWSEQLNEAIAVGKRKGILDFNGVDIEAQIRKSVKSVVQCDVLRDDIVPLEELTSVETKPPYDVILSCLCLQAAAPDYDAYIATLKRINKMLRPGGGLIVCDFANADEYWTAGNKKFHYLNLSLDEVSEAFRRAGFRVVKVQKFTPDEQKHYFKFGTSFCCFAEKL
ncbi:nicotinamide N-methyltransferase-like [Uloborus diversus]|uniref:nicotinamide N-methyltransferase-like n=1 Tax=Uloborus diversus TaxID=327109 RepID=UPI0024097CFC|nr:nicotinamide N-methyltransferase-like [Uloborus diversus]